MKRWMGLIDFGDEASSDSDTGNAQHDSAQLLNVSVQFHGYSPLGLHLDDGAAIFR